jgi:hypothetical protein
LNCHDVTVAPRATVFAGVATQLAGHSDIKTTQQFYLSVQPDNVTKAQKVQESLLGSVLLSAPTDQKLTNSAPGRELSSRKVFRKDARPQSDA